MTPDEILEHPLFHKKKEEPLYILKDIMSPDQSPEREEEEEEEDKQPPRGYIHPTKL